MSEEIEGHLGMGRHVSLRQLFNAAPLQTVMDDLVLFEGQIESIETAIGPEGETVELTARDFSAVLEHMTVYGQHVDACTGGTIFLSGLETAFNPGGKGNAGTEPAVANGQTCTVFSAEAAGARAWRLAEVIEYLLKAHLPAGRLHWPGIEQLLALTEARAARDLDVTGLSLLEALHHCCDWAGLQFRFVPRSIQTGPRQAVVFYRNGRGRVIELNCQPVGQPLSLSRTSIGALHSRRDVYPLTHRYIGQGDFKVYEATFELVKAWDPALEGVNYYTFCPSANPEFHKVRDVYRRWCLNEAGDYSREPYNRGLPCDLTGIFEGGSYVRRRRRFWPTLSTDSQGRPLGYSLEVSYDDGLNWWQYFHAFNNLLDECGIWLSSDQLDVDIWVAVLKGVLRFRVTAAVVSDERLTCTVANGPVGSTAPVIDHVLTLPRRFQYRKVSPHSVLAGTEGFGKPNEVDDTAALYEFVRRHASASEAIIEITDLQTPALALHFEPGDRVTSGPDSRDLLSCRRDNRSLVWIDHVRMDFKSQCTHLGLIRQRPWSE
ncbi:MAG: hypothetical protein EHM35_10630 [Planctomycetaceae bacterium]|nr:MAG: hypothetical protein EHM35_10630 [Planctomycetaceae bacterium]